MTEEELTEYGSIYHRNGRIAYVGPGATNSGYAYHDNGSQAFINSGTAYGMAYYRNGATAFVGPGRTNSGYAYYQNGQLASRDGRGISFSIGPGIKIHVSNQGCNVSVDGD